jgi:branched-chain amino acid transport system permease protein
MDFWLSNTFSGVSFGMLLFLLASGLTLTLGLLRIINLAHGSFYLLGSYFGLTASSFTNNFFLAVLIGATGVGVLGMALQWLLLRRYATGELAQVLLTFGCLFFFADFALYMWGGHPVYVPSPNFLQRSMELGTTAVSTYKLMVIALGAAVGVFLWWFQERTRYGAIIRAGVDDEQMTEGMGINIILVKSLVFGLGALLAGLAGVIGGSFIGAYPGVDMEVLLLSLIVVVIGGAGSLRGSLVGALLTGLVRNFSVAFIPQFSLAIIFVPMVVILVLRSHGLFGRK